MSEITIRRVPWSDQMETDLRAAMDYMPPHADMDFYKTEVQSEHMYALGLMHEEEFKAWGLYYFEGCNLGKELVVVCTVGDLPGVDLIKVVTPVWEKMALDAGCLSLRFHTNRRGLIKKMAKQGYGMAEFVMRKSFVGKYVDTFGRPIDAEGNIIVEANPQVKVPGQIEFNGVH